MPLRLLALLGVAAVLGGCGKSSPVAVSDPGPTTSDAPATTTAPSKPRKPKAKRGPPKLPRMDGEVLAVVRGRDVVFVSLEGRRLARIDDAYAAQYGGPRISVGRIDYTLENGRLVSARQRPKLFRIPGFGKWCSVLGETSAGRLVSCVSRGPLLIVRSDGTYDTFIPEPPSHYKDSGHWEHAFVSPDGSRLLLTWSGECEVPNAFFAPATGGAATPVTGQRKWADEPNSVALGWARDGRALVVFTDAACGSGIHTPGVYAIDASGEKTLLAAGTGAAFFRG